MVFGAYDEKAGAAGTVTDLLTTRLFNHRCVVEGGVLREPCARLLTGFFLARRGPARDGRAPE